MSKWIECSSCEEEFQVISSAMEDPKYCCFCGAEVEDPEEDLWDEEEE